MLFQSKEKRFLIEVGKVFNPFLISKIEQEKDQIKVYAAIKATIQDDVLQKFGESREKSGQKMRGRSLTEFMDSIKERNKRDPKSIFFLLVEIYARLFTKEEFEKFFKTLLSEDISLDFLDVMIFKNSKLNLQFKDS